MEEEIGKIIGGVMMAAIAIGVVVVVGVFLLPVVVVGGGGLWYVYNVHLPEKRRKETSARLDRLYAEAKRYAPTKEAMRKKLAEAGITDPELHSIASTLFDQEGLEAPSSPPVAPDAIAAARYQDQVDTFIKAARGDRFDGFVRHLIDVLGEYEPVEEFEDLMFGSSRERSRKEIERLMLRFLNDDGYCKSLIATLDANYNGEGEQMPPDCRHEDYAWRYLKGTPLLSLRYVNERIGLRDRMYHTYLLGSSGSGKTNLIENIIANDLNSDADPCVVVIDSQTQLTEKLAALDIDNTAYFSPQFNLALNLFDVGYERLRGQGIEGETLINKTVGLLSFVMEGMMGTAFTNPQRTIFQYAIQLVISVKGGNIFTFMEILSEDGLEKYQHEVGQLDANTRRFFEVDFGSPDYKRTREAIRRRLDSLLLNPTFRRLFSATDNHIDMVAELNNRKLILIDTNKPMLDGDASAFFGRLFIAMILRAAHQRFGDGKWMRPVHLIVDEAHEYFDQSIADMLEQARKANIGLVVAHQSLSQAKGRGANASIADPLMVNTATKIIWTSYKEDAAKFAGSMQVPVDTILNLPQFTFGLHSRKQGFLPIRGHADILKIFPERADRNSLKEEMEERYGQAASTEKEPPRAEERAEETTEPPESSAANEAGPPDGPEPRGKRPPPPDVDMI